MFRSAIFTVTALFVSAVAIAAAIADEIHKSWVIACAIIALMLLIVLYRAILMPLRTAKNGLNLLKSQDTSNRLARVGQADADEIVELFNSLMSTLRTERIKGEEKSHLVSMLIAMSPMAIVILDFDKKISIVNKSFSKMFGISTDIDITGKALSELGGEAAMLEQIHENAPQILRPGGSRIWRCSRLNFIDNGFNRQFIIVETLTDEIVKAEKEAYGRVIRTLSHEINNTLGGVLPIMDIAASSVDDTEVKEAIFSAMERCSGMADFVSSFASVMKIPQPVKKSVDLNSLITNLRPVLESIAGNRACLTINTAEIPVIAEADMAMIQQAIINIVKNSAESIIALNNPDKTGIIAISVTDSPATIQITDNGAGIKAADSNMLFTPFYSTKRNGHGIGLMFVAETLRNHNCHFTLATSKNDSLTRFTIVFN